VGFIEDSEWARSVVARLQRAEKRLQEARENGASIHVLALVICNVAQLQMEYERLPRRLVA
jgi:hypothetical protein